MCQIINSGDFWKIFSFWLKRAIKCYNYLDSWNKCLRHFKSNQLVNETWTYGHWLIKGPHQSWVGSLTLFDAWSLWQVGQLCLRIPQWWQKCWVYGPLCDFGRDFPLSIGLATNGFGGFVKTLWVVTFGFFSSFTFSTIGVATIGSFALTNFISLDTLALELLSPMYSKPLLSEKGFWCTSNLSNFLETLQQWS